MEDIYLYTLYELVRDYVRFSSLWQFRRPMRLLHIAEYFPEVGLDRERLVISYDLLKDEAIQILEPREKREYRLVRMEWFYDDDLMEWRDSNDPPVHAEQVEPTNIHRVNTLVSQEFVDTTISSFSEISIPMIKTSPRWGTTNASDFELFIGELLMGNYMWLSWSKVAPANWEPLAEIVIAIRKRFEHEVKHLLPPNDEWFALRWYLEHGDEQLRL